MKAKPEYAQLRIRRQTMNKLKKLLANHIGEKGTPVSMTNFMEVVVERMRNT